MQVRGKQMAGIKSRFGKLIATVCLVLAAALPVSVSAQSVATQSRVSPVAPRRAEVEAAVRAAYEKFRGDPGGKNADYIPYLAQVDSKLFGIAVVTTDNQVITIGDV
jgi:glutaminase